MKEAPPEPLRVFPLSFGRGTPPLAWQSQFHGGTGLERASSERSDQRLAIGIFFIVFINGLFKENPMSIQAINVRNQFKGKVREIIRGDVVSEVDVETPWGIVTSVITTRSVDDLGLVVGSDVVALVKSTEVSIAKL